MSKSVKRQRTDIKPLSAFQKALFQAKQKLHVSAVPNKLPCRDAEFNEISVHIEAALQDGQGTTISERVCVDVSGVPGTGKTATIREILRQLTDRSGDASAQEVPKFDSLEINGMTLSDPIYAYSMLWKVLQGSEMAAGTRSAAKTKRRRTTSDKLLPPAQAEEELSAYFESATRKRKRKPCVVIMDELDQMVTRKQSVIYSFFDWPHRSGSNLIVVAIANTMDLPERMLSNKISSRLGLTRIHFEPYSHEQLTKIVKSRLEGLNVFDKHSIELCCRKVSAVSGDARRALDICRRAAEIAQSRSDNKLITVDIISETVREMSSTPACQVIRNASNHQKIFLYSISVIMRQTGLQETTFGEVVRKHTEFCRMNSLEPPTTGQLSILSADLAGLRIILAQVGRWDLYQKIRLNVSEEDLTMSFRLDDFMKKYAN